MVQIIVNSLAGNGEALNAAEKASAILSERNIKHKIHETKYEMHALEIARECVSSGETTAIYCVGGDGTIHEVVGGMVNSSVPLGLIPAGSGNDFTASMKNYNKISVPILVERFLAGKSEKIDIIRCKSEDTEFYCANIASLGMDAEIAYNAAKYKRRLGRFAYLAATLGTILKYSKKKMRIIADETETEANITLAAVCNGKVYGGGFKIAPSALINDGLITLCVINKMSKATMSVLFPSVLVGLHTKLKPVSFVNCKKVCLSFNGIEKLNVDGNIYNITSYVEFEIMKGALKVFI